MWQEAEYARRIDELRAGAAELSVELSTERGLREAVEAKVLAKLADSAATEATLRVRLAKATQLCTLYDKVVMQWPCTMLLIAGAMRRGMRCDHD